MKNDFLVEKSDAMLILYDQEQPGTPKFYLEPTLKKQNSQSGYMIYYLTPEDIEDARREEEMDW
nr:SLOG family protein [Alkalicoccobacillus plakortidis]